MHSNSQLKIYISISDGKLLVSFQEEVVTHTDEKRPSEILRRRKSRFFSFIALVRSLARSLARKPLPLESNQVSLMLYTLIR